MTRNRLASRAGRWGLVLLLALGGGPAARAQPAAVSPASSPVPPPSDSEAAAAPQPAASNLTWLWVLLGGVALGVLGARLWARRSPASTPVPEPAVSPGTVPKKPAENVVVRPPLGQSLRALQDSVPAPLPPKSGLKPPGTGQKPKHNPKRNSPARPSQSWPTTVPQRSTMNPTPPTVPPTGDQPLETGQTVEWAAPTSTPPAIQELIAASAPDALGPPAETADIAPEAAAPAAPAPGNGPLHYYAPAPDVPSIEHRKLSSNPLPQMPLLITLPHAEASTAQFSFSPQADQSRIIGNGVRELKEFFQFELPPTEQFTAIRNLTPGRLEKRDDAWHVVQKAEIALS